MVPDIYRYRTQHLRGTKEEWENAGNIIPLAGELVIELDDSEKGLHRLKIGDGKTPYADLPYLSVDSFILPKPLNITILASEWILDQNNRYYQEVSVDNYTITPNSKVDL